MPWVRGAGVFAAALCLLAARPSSAYEFEVSASTIGQGSTLRALGLGTNASTLTRRRITQSLQLHLWDLAGTRDAFARWDPTPPKGPKIFLSSYLRLDQEQGNFAVDTLLLDGRVRDVIDVIPELERSSLQLDLLYGFVGAEGLLGGAIDVYAGRQMDVQTLDWFSMDGVKVRAHLPVSAQVEAFAGLRVRDNSFGASDAFAPDGTSAAFCEEFVEGDGVVSGSWRPIDGLPDAVNNPYTSDDELCPQRDQRMPTVGFAIATEGLQRVSARLSYRRSHSASPGLLGDADRLDNPDEGYYPFEREIAASGVTEERLALSVRGNLRPRGLRVTPYAAVRYSALHGIVDEAHAGTKVHRASHSVEPEVFYSSPTFDGDSIFNIFSTEPYTDARLTWRFTPKRGAWSGYLRGWGRRYHSEDAEQSTGDLAASVYAGGGNGGLRMRRDDYEMRLDAYAEDGYGGQRIGGLYAAGISLSPNLVVHGRASLIRFADDSRSEIRGTNAGLQLGTRYQINRGLATSLLIEQNSNSVHRFALAAFAVVDLAFQPKT